MTTSARAAALSSVQLRGVRPVGRVQLSGRREDDPDGGATGYIYPNDARLHHGRQHGRDLRQGGVRRAAEPEVGGLVRRRQDQGRVLRGEHLATPCQPKDEKFSVVLGALAGLQRRARDSTTIRTSDESFNFADNGFTHLDLSARRAVHRRACSRSRRRSTSSINGDEATKFTSPHEDRQQGREGLVRRDDQLVEGLGEEPEEETADGVGAAARASP